MQGFGFLLHRFVSFVLVFFGLFITQFFSRWFQLLAVGNKKPLQVGFLIRRVVLFVVVLNLAFRDLRGLLLQVLSQHLR